MGFYDCRCMITGVSVKADEAVLVCILQQDGDPPEYVPIALPMKGTYDRLGAIDNINEDANTDLILRYFLKAQDTEELIVDQEYLADIRLWGSNEPCYPIKKIQHLIAAFERNVNESPDIALWNDRPVMISQEIWNAPVRSAGIGATDQDVFQQVFGSSTVAHGIYDGHLPEVARHLAEMSIITAFLAEQGIKWKSEEDAGQHYEEVGQYLREARHTFRIVPAIVSGLDDYENKITRLGLLDEG